MSVKLLLKLSPEERAERTLTHLLSEKSLLGVAEQGCFVMLSAEGDACTPLFSDQELAAAWIQQNYPEAKVCTVSLTQLQTELFDPWSEDEIMMMLNPAPDEEDAIVVKVDELRQAIAEESEN